MSTSFLRKRFASAPLLLATLFMAAGHLHATSYVDFTGTLGGSTNDYQWSGFADATRPAGVSSGVSGTAGQWLQGIAPSNAATNIVYSGNSSFPTDTTDFLASSSGGGIYSFFSRTNFQVSNSSVAGALESLIFQVSMANGADSFANIASGGPTLTITTALGTQILSATYAAALGSTPAVVFGMPTNVSLLAYQWDLSSIGSPILNYSIDWQVAQHSVSYGADVTESSSIVHENVLSSVPESAPGLFSLAGGLLGSMVFRNRGRRKA